MDNHFVGDILSRRLLWYFRRELRQSSVRQVITEHLTAYKNRIGHYPQTTNPENLADSLSLNLNLNEIDPDNFSYRPSDRSGGYQLKILK